MQDISLSISILAITFTILNFIWIVHIRKEDNKNNIKNLRSELLTDLVNLKKLNNDNILAYHQLLIELNSLFPNYDKELEKLLKLMFKSLGFVDIEQYKNDIKEKTKLCESTMVIIQEKYEYISNKTQISSYKLDNLLNLKHHIDSLYIETNAQIENSYKASDVVLKFKKHILSIAHARNK